MAASAFLQRWPSFAAELQLSCVDDMSNEVTIEYGLWPERVVLLRHGRADWVSDFERYGAEELLDAAGRVFASTSNRDLLGASSGSAPEAQSTVVRHLSNA